MTVAEPALLTPSDEGVHAPGSEPSWNESRYVDTYDRDNSIGAWLRIGNRPNEGRAEVTVCVNLPDGMTAFMFERAPITTNGLSAGGLAWTIEEPFRRGRVTYRGAVLLLRDAWALTDPKRAFAESRRVDCEIDLETVACGIESVMGHDQEDIDRIFLPGQADHHYQHLVRSTGTVRIDDRVWSIDGRGGRDHSWGPRNWLSKHYLRWLIGSVDDAFGFMLTRAVGPTKQTRGGFVWDDRTFHLADDVELHSTYGGPPHHELRRVDVVIRSGPRTWRAIGEPRAWVPLRHTARTPHGQTTTLRIVKSPTTWAVDGRAGAGMAEYHDLIENGRPVGLHD